MTSTSTLGYALLGLLARQPRTGYDLSVAMQRPIGYFWAAGHSQIYPELARLEAARYATHRVVAGPGPRDTKRYSITAAGRRALRDWVASPTRPTPSKDEFLLKVYSLWLVDPPKAASVVRAEADEHRKALREYERLQREVEARHPTLLQDPSTPEFSSYATLRRGLSFEWHVIGWCEWLIAVLETGPEPPVG